MSRKLRAKPFIISSRDRDSTKTGESTHNFTLNLTAKRELTDLVGIRVRSCTMHNTAYNVNAYNNQISYTRTSDAKVFTDTIPVGYYSFTQLMTQLTSLIEANLGVGFLYTSSAITGKIVITFPVSVTFADSALNKIAKNLGYQDYTGVGAVHTAPYIIDLSGPDNAYVHIYPLGVGEIRPGVDSKGGNTICAVPLSESKFGSQVSFFSHSSAENELIYSNPANINHLKIQIKDIDGNLIDLSNTEWVITLMALYR